MSLLRKMRHVTAHIKEPYYDVEMDIEEMKRSRTGNEFIWIVRRNGTTLIPSPHVFMKDTTFNLMAEEMVAQPNARVYHIRLSGSGKKVQGRRNYISGEIRPIGDFSRVLKKFTCTPHEIRGVLELKSGEEIEKIISFHPSFFERFCRKASVPEEMVKCVHLTEIIF